MGNKSIAMGVVLGLGAGARLFTVYNVKNGFYHNYIDPCNDPRRGPATVLSTMWKLTNSRYQYYLLIPVSFIIILVTIVTLRRSYDETFVGNNNLKFGYEQQNLFNTEYRISYHPALQIRGNWQQKQINKFCEEHGFGNLTYSLDIVEPLKAEFYRHLIMNHRARKIYCFLPKTGCTTARAVMFASQRMLSKESLFMAIENREEFEGQLDIGIAQLSFNNSQLTDAIRIKKLKKYGKYIIVRHPLQRILSAYLDKMSSPLLPRDHLPKYDHGMHVFKHDIMKRYHPDKYSYWVEHNKTELSISFQDYIMWLNDFSPRNLTLLNEHFSPQYDNSQPCRVRYHFYGNFDHFKEDFTLILNEFRIDASLLMKLLPPKKGGSTSEKINLFWSPLPSQLKHRLYSQYKIDFDFYHALYPSEMILTKRLLDL